MKNHEGFCVLHVLNPLVQRQDITEEELQMKTDVPREGLESGRIHPEVGPAIQQARGDGKPLERLLQEQVGSSLGYDFSRVRIHTGPEANELNSQLSARAFTIGSDIFFAQGAYDPDSIGGRELIAHELIHVVQQRNGGESGDARGMTVRPAGDEFEQEAENLSQIVAGTREVLTEPLVRRRLPEVSAVQRALRNQTQNINNFPAGVPLTCLDVVLFWLCREALASSPNPVTGANMNQACGGPPGGLPYNTQQFMDNLVRNARKRSRRRGKCIIGNRPIIVDPGSVLFFRNAGRVAHVCVMGDSATGALGLKGINQGGGWWDGSGHAGACPHYNVCSHNPSEIKWSGWYNASVRAANVDYSVYTLPGHKAVKAVKHNLGIP